ncbi:MAG: FtsQ-type POTRA domain-containing protein [Clostridia bacterium]|nr:FtsQ-type POTRA domain-containing protein [Clostridia bacterium]
MSEKENKFILGDNSDGYRRSSEETQPVVLPEYMVRRQRPAPARKPAQRPSAKGRPAPQARKKTAATKSVKKPVKRKTNGRPEENQSLSRNEKIKLHNEQRRRQKRRKQIINYAAVCLAVLALAVVLSLTVFFQVNEFVIKGKSPYTEEQIINACGIRMGENIIRCDAKSVGDKLSQALPYIGSAAVERSASGKVTITVKTVEPCWSVINGEQAVLIDAGGKVLEIASAEKALEATIVQGIVVSEAVPGQAVVLQEDVPFSYLDTIGKAIASADIDKLTSLNLSDTDYMQALYDGRINIIIGGSDNLTMKLALASEVIKRENSIDPAQYGTIDLTIDDMAYFRPQEEDAPYAPEEETSAEDTDNGASDTAAVA